MSSVGGNGGYMARSGVIPWLWLCGAVATSVERRAHSEVQAQSRSTRICWHGGVGRGRRATLKKIGADPYEHVGEGAREEKVRAFPDSKVRDK